MGNVAGEMSRGDVIHTENQQQQQQPRSLRCNKAIQVSVTWLCS